MRVTFLGQNQKLYFFPQLEKENGKTRKNQDSVFYTNPLFIQVTK